MKQRETETGAVAPLVVAAGTTTPAHWRDSSEARAAPLSMGLGLGEEGEANGQRLLDRVRRAVAALHKGGRTDKNVREMRRLVKELPSLVMACPEFCDYMKWLQTHRQHEAIKQILAYAPRFGRDAAGGRGRKLASYGYLVAMVDLVLAQEGGSVALACKRLRDELSPSPFAYFATAASMEKAYCEHKDLVHDSTKYWVPPEELARVPQVLPDDE